MGIRYYAYAFDAHRSCAALEDPCSVMADDPFADAFGLESFSSGGATDPVRVPPKRDFLYLDKAWEPLQWMTSPEANSGRAHSAYLIFEGRVRPCPMDENAWHAFRRTVLPGELPAVARGLDDLTGRIAEDLRSARRRKGAGSHQDLEYVHAHAQAAAEFVDGLVREGRGMVYEIS